MSPDLIITVWPSSNALNAKKKKTGRQKLERKSRLDGKNEKKKKTKKKKPWDRSSGKTKNERVKRKCIADTSGIFSYLLLKVYILWLLLICLILGNMTKKKKKKAK